MPIVKTLTGSDTDVATITTASFGRLGLQIVNSVAQLTAFKIQIRTAVDAPWHTMYSSAGDYTTPAKTMIAAGNKLGAALDFTTMASTGNDSAGYILLDVIGLNAIKIVAAGNTAIISVYGSMT